MRRVVSISLSDRIARELERLGKKLRRPRSLIVREALERYVLEARLDDLRARLRSYAARGGIVSDEDVFSRVS